MTFLVRARTHTHTVAVHVEAVKQLSGDKLTERERGHIRSLLANASGDLPKATEELVAVLIEHPLGEWSTGRRAH